MELLGICHVAQATDLKAFRVRKILRESFPALLSERIELLRSMRRKMGTREAKEYRVVNNAQSFTVLAKYQLARFAKLIYTTKLLQANLARSDSH